MQAEEAGADEKGEPDEEHARVIPLPRLLRQDETEPDIDDCDGEDEPEMRGVMLTVGVEAGPCMQERQAAERQSQ